MGRSATLARKVFRKPWMFYEDMPFIASLATVFPVNTHDRRSYCNQHFLNLGEALQSIHATLSCESIGMGTFLSIWSIYGANVIIHTLALSRRPCFLVVLSLLVLESFLVQLVFFPVPPLLVYPPCSGSTQPR